MSAIFYPWVTAKVVKITVGHIIGHIPLSHTHADAYMTHDVNMGMYQVSLCFCFYLFIHFSCFYKNKSPIKVTYVFSQNMLQYFGTFLSTIPLYDHHSHTYVCSYCLRKKSILGCYETILLSVLLIWLNHLMTSLVTSSIWSSLIGWLFKDFWCSFSVKQSSYQMIQRYRISRKSRRYLINQIRYWLAVQLPPWTDAKSQFLWIAMHLMYDL